MKKIEEIFEDLIATIEKNAINNKAEITNVKLWADGWRNELSQYGLRNEDQENEEKHEITKNELEQIMELKVKIEEFEEFGEKLSNAYKIALLENLTRSEKLEFAERIDKSKRKDALAVCKEATSLSIKRIEEAKKY